MAGDKGELLGAPTTLQPSGLHSEARRGELGARAPLVPDFLLRPWEPQDIWASLQLWSNPLSFLLGRVSPLPLVIHKVSVCGPHWPAIHRVDQAGLKSAGYKDHHTWLNLSFNRCPRKTTAAIALGAIRGLSNNRVLSHASVSSRSHLRSPAALLTAFKAAKTAAPTDCARCTPALRPGLTLRRQRSLPSAGTALHHAFRAALGARPRTHPAPRRARDYDPHNAVRRARHTPTLTKYSRPGLHFPATLASAPALPPETRAELGVRSGSRSGSRSLSPPPPPPPPPPTVPLPPGHSTGRASCILHSGRCGDPSPGSASLRRDTPTPPSPPARATPPRTGPPSPCAVPEPPGPDSHSGLGTPAAAAPHPEHGLRLLRRRLPPRGWDSDTPSSGSCATVSPDQVKEIKTEGKRTIVRQGKQVVFRDEDSTGNDEDIMVDSDDDSWDLVTCFCMKPFAGRPMIECNECHTWIHLSCAKIRKSNVPEVFVCQKCRDSKFDIRRSNRSRMGSRKLFLD
ncbi:hypothetical protein NN561_003346 [Cricetulus griseus]